MSHNSVEFPDFATKILTSLKSDFDLGLNCDVIFKIKSVFGADEKIYRAHSFVLRAFFPKMGRGSSALLDFDDGEIRPEFLQRFLCAVYAGVPLALTSESEKDQLKKIVHNLGGSEDLDLTKILFQSPSMSVDRISTVDLYQLDQQQSQQIMDQGQTSRVNGHLLAVNQTPANYHQSIEDNAPMDLVEPKVEQNEEEAAFSYEEGQDPGEDENDSKETKALKLETQEKLVKKTCSSGRTMRYVPCLYCPETARYRTTDMNRYRKHLESVHPGKASLWPHEPYNYEPEKVVYLDGKGEITLRTLFEMTCNESSSFEQGDGSFVKNVPCLLCNSKVVFNKPKTFYSHLDKIHAGIGIPWPRLAKHPKKVKNPYTLPTQDLGQIMTMTTYLKQLTSDACVKEAEPTSGETLTWVPCIFCNPMLMFHNIFNYSRHMNLKHPGYPDLWPKHQQQMDQNQNQIVKVEPATEMPPELPQTPIPHEQLLRQTASQALVGMMEIQSETPQPIQQQIQQQQIEISVQQHYSNTQQLPQPLRTYDSSLTRVENVAQTQGLQDDQDRLLKLTEAKAKILSGPDIKVPCVLCPEQPVFTSRKWFGNHFSTNHPSVKEAPWPVDMVWEVANPYVNSNINAQPQDTKAIYDQLAGWTRDSARRETKLDGSRAVFIGCIYCNPMPMFDQKAEYQNHYNRKHVGFMNLWLDLPLEEELPVKSEVQTAVDFILHQEQLSMQQVQQEIVLQQNFQLQSQQQPAQQHQQSMPEIQSEGMSHNGAQMQRELEQISTQMQDTQHQQEEDRQMQGLQQQHQQPATDYGNSLDERTAASVQHCNKKNDQYGVKKVPCVLCNSSPKFTNRFSFAKHYEDKHPQVPCPSWPLRAHKKRERIPNPHKAVIPSSLDEIEAMKDMLIDMAKQLKSKDTTISGKTVTVTPCILCDPMPMYDDKTKYDKHFKKNHPGVDGLWPNTKNYLSETPKKKL